MKWLYFSRLVVLSSLLSVFGACGEDELDGLPEDYATDSDYGTPGPVLDGHEHHHRQDALGTFVGGPQAHLKGDFADPHDWPVIPIAVVLMPNGQVMAYGTDGVGKQSALASYATWDPATGSFNEWTNGTHSDIFCAGQALIPGGGALFVGGEASVNGETNYAQNDVNRLELDGGLVSGGSMEFNRWYSTLVTLPSGEHLVLGGRDSKDFDAGTSGFPSTVATFPVVPEIRAKDGTWRTLTTAGNEFAFGRTANAWNYPRAWVNPQGKVFVLGYGKLFELDTANTGTVTQYPQTIPPGLPIHASVMYAPGKILSLRKNRAAVVVDINGAAPVVTDGGYVAFDRQYGSATVLADGKVWVNGGSPTGNSVADAGLDSEMWSPGTGKWQKMAPASIVRLYHSTSLLLPDGTVFTGGGGAPGPLTNLNGEIYYPPYLFKKDGSGELAPKPTITTPPSIAWNANFDVVGSEPVTKVTLLRMGGATHNFNNEARFFTLKITAVDGNKVTVKAPGSRNVAPPGYYMVFGWNAAGVPSIAKIVQMN